MHEGLAWLSGHKGTWIRTKIFFTCVSCDINHGRHFLYPGWKSFFTFCAFCGNPGSKVAGGVGCRPWTPNLQIPSQMSCLRLWGHSTAMPAVFQPWSGKNINKAEKGDLLWPYPWHYSLHNAMEARTLIKVLAEGHNIFYNSQRVKDYYDLSFQHHTVYPIIYNMY